MSRTRSRNRTEFYPNGGTITRWRINLASKEITFVKENVGTYGIPRTETIIDQPGPMRSTNGTMLWKECLHTRTAHHPLSFTQRFEVTSRDDLINQYYFAYETSNSKVHFLPRTSDVPQQALPSMGDVYSALQKEINGEIDTDALLLSTIYELISGKGPLSASLSSVKSAKKTFKSRTIRDILTNASSAELAYRFGVKTFLRDVVSVASMMDAVSNHMAKLAYRSTGAPVVFKTTKSNSANYPIEHLYPTDSRLTKSKTIRPTRTLERTAYATRTLFMKGIARYDVSDTTFTYQILKRLGFLNPLTTAWDLVPFSFVVDYFIDVQRRITALEDAVASRVYKPLVSLIELTPTWAADKVGLKIVAPPAETSYSHPAGTHYSTWEGGLILDQMSFKRYPVPPSSLNQSSGWDFNKSLTTRQHLTMLQLFLQNTHRR